MTDQAITYLMRNYKEVGMKQINIIGVCSLSMPIPLFEEHKCILAWLVEPQPLCERLK